MTTLSQCRQRDDIGQIAKRVWRHGRLEGLYQTDVIDDHSRVGMATRQLAQERQFGPNT